MTPLRPATCAGLALCTLTLVIAAPNPAYGRIELIRDTWGIPHVFSETDHGAIYGLGYATAEQRGFQMTYNLRIIQGRLAETIGDRSKPGRRDTTVDHDRKMRTFGWTHAASRTAAALDSETIALLNAYCEGVNDSFAAQKKAGTLHPLFAQLDITPEPWTPAHCLLNWWHLAQFFATDGTRDLITWRNRTRPPPGQPTPPIPAKQWADDSTSVVRREDVSEEWLRKIETFAASLNDEPTGAIIPTASDRKFSHSWVVGGAKSTTGSATLVSDPQTPVRNPPLFIEFHVSGRTFNARGIGVPGSPALLIGFSTHVAWGLTALGADQADLFLLETDPDHPDQYRWNSAWQPMDVRTETIRVKDGPNVSLVVRETHLGPLISPFAFRSGNEPEVALKRVPLCESNRDTIQAAFGMIRARDTLQLTRALADWRFPTANCIYGDTSGRIGYSVIGAIPIRSHSAPDPNGASAMPGTEYAHDWRGFVPPELLPRIADPKQGFLFSANHRPVGSFYPIPLGLSTGSMGDTIRSWRLRELLASKTRFSPRDVLDLHLDTVNPARRDIVRIGLHLRNTQPDSLSASSRRALDTLEPWLEEGASSDLNQEGAALATRISTFFRFVNTPLASQYGGGESGLAKYLKDAITRINANPNASCSNDELQFIDGVLSAAWDVNAGDNAPAARARQSNPPAMPRTLGWFDSLDGFGSLDHANDLETPAITCLDGQTILSQASQSYTQWIPLHDVDSAKSLCPIGHSDRPDDPFRTSTMQLWAKGSLHPAPLSRKALNAITAQYSLLAP
jgi:penicillin G amidase